MTMVRYGSPNVAFGGPARDPGAHARADGQPLYGPGVDRPRVEMRELRTCTIQIWPSWAPHYVTCGSTVQNGRCAKYGHESR